MNINIFCINSNIKYQNINIINIFNKKNNFSIMKNHIFYIGELEKIIFQINNKLLNINFFNGYFIQKKNLFTIVCDFYNFN